MGGRYYKAPPDTPPYPGWHLYGSRNWQAGQWQVNAILGESRQAVQRWSNGAAPEPLPIPQVIGSAACIADGEQQLPPKRWELVRSDQQDGGVVIQVSINWPDTVFTWPANVPGCCQPILADDDNVVLADDDQAVNASCACECLPVLADDNNVVLADDDHAVLASCPQCLPILDDDDNVVLADDEHAVEASCGGA